VKVVHGVDRLARYVGVVTLEPDTIVGSAPLSRYQHFLRDKQEVLSYQSDKVREYAAVTERRAAPCTRRSAAATSSCSRGAAPSSPPR